MAAFRSDFLVSIQCMTYNHAPYIEDAMNGFCMQQTTFPYVAIIVDDASNDGEQEVIRRYLNAHFNMIEARQWETDDAIFIYARHKENENCYFAVILLKYNFWQTKKEKAPLYKKFEANAKYLAICEGDDYWIDENKLQRQFDFLENHPDYSICSHDHLYFEQDKGKVKENSAYRALFLSRPFDNGYFDYSLDNYFEGWWAHPLTCMYRNGSYLKEIPKHKYQHYRDDIFFYYVLKTGKGALLNRTMGVYRIHEGGVWSSHDATEKMKMAIANAYNIYIVEGDKRAFISILRNQYDMILYLKNNGRKRDIGKELMSFYKMDPLPVFCRLVFNLLRYDMWMLKQGFLK